MTIIENILKALRVRYPQLKALHIPRDAFPKYTRDDNLYFPSEFAVMRQYSVAMTMSEVDTSFALACAHELQVSASKSAEALQSLNPDDSYKDEELTILVTYRDVYSQGLYRSCLFSLTVLPPGVDARAAFTPIFKD